MILQDSVDSLIGKHEYLEKEMCEQVNQYLDHMFDNNEEGVSNGKIIVG